MGWAEILTILVAVLGSGGVVAVITTRMNNKHTLELQEKQFSHAWEIEIIKKRIGAILDIDHFIGELNQRRHYDPPGLNAPSLCSSLSAIQKANNVFLEKIQPLQSLVDPELRSQLSRYNEYIVQFGNRATTYEFLIRQKFGSGIKEDNVIKKYMTLYLAYFGFELMTDLGSLIDQINGSLKKNFQNVHDTSPILSLQQNREEEYLQMQRQVINRITEIHGSVQKKVEDVILHITDMS